MARNRNLFGPLNFFRRGAGRLMRSRKVLRRPRLGTRRTR